MRLSTALRYSAPPDLLVVIRGGEGGKGKERVGNSRHWEEGQGMEGREGVWRDEKGRGRVGMGGWLRGRETAGRETEGKARLGYLSRGP